MNEFEEIFERKNFYKIYNEAFIEVFLSGVNNYKYPYEKVRGYHILTVDSCIANIRWSAGEHALHFQARLNDITNRASKVPKENQVEFFQNKMREVKQEITRCFLPIETKDDVNIPHGNILCSRKM
jgi:hypothetical protein